MGFGRHVVAASIAAVLAAVPPFTTGHVTRVEAAERAEPTTRAQGARPGVPIDARHIGEWSSPTGDVRIVSPFRAPADRYSAGHRGIDLDAPVGSALTAPAQGVVAFSGPVADRNVLTIDHGGGFVSTLEPITEGLPPGTPVEAGDAVASVGTGGHATLDTVHFGVRLHGEYVNPLLLLGDVPRAVLRPCC